MRSMRKLLLRIEGLDFGVGVGIFMMEAVGFWDICYGSKDGVFLWHIV